MVNEKGYQVIDDIDEISCCVNQIKGSSER